MPPLPCPTNEQLLAFNEGRADDALLDQISEHLEACETCVDRLENLPAGKLAERLRRSVQFLFEDASSNNQSAREADSPHLRESLLDSETPVQVAEFLSSSYFHLGFDRYQLLALIGSGRWATVYLASNENHESVAVKIPRRELLPTEDHQKIFLKDANLSRALNHPNIVPVVDFGFWQTDIPFVGSRFIGGPTLKTFAKTKQRISADSLRVAITQIAAALQHAHHNNVIHRHLHPNNIHFDTSKEKLQIKVGDFAVHHDGRYFFDLLQPVQQPNPFESREVIYNDPEYIDHRSDIFALGKVLKLLLQKTDGLSEKETAHWKMVQQTCCCPRRRDRFQSVHEFFAALGDC